MTLSNDQLAAAFEQLADLLEFDGANAFRVRAYRTAVRAIADHPVALGRAILEEGFDPRAIDGIGDAVADKLKVLLQTGELPQLETLKAKVPVGVLDLLRVPGLGPKKAAALFRELGIDSLPTLAEACREDRVRQLKGFGAKTQASILHGIEIASAANQRKLWAEVDPLVERLRSHLEGIVGVRRLEFAGSYRRRRDTVGDLDVLVESDEPEAVMDALAAFEDVRETIGRGGTKLSVRTRDAFQVDLRVVPAESFGAALQYFTGSKEHNVEVRSRAKAAGLKVNEWGVFRIGEGGSETYLAGRTERDVYASIGLPWIPPELREARHEFDWADAGPLPELLERSDLRGDLHMHTVDTDGRATLEEMIEGARRHGLEYIAITDHSKRVSMARGLDAARLLEQWARIDAWNRDHGDGFRVLKGIECDILEAGGMDLPDDILAQADWVVASVHYGQQQSRQQITDRILGAVTNRWVDAVAHPTGRLLLRREPYEVDLDAVMQACVEHGTALELNANPHRLDLDDVQVDRAASMGIPIVIDSDAHAVEGFEDLRYGVLQARRGGLTAAQVLNSRPLDELRAWLARRRER